MPLNTTENIHPSDESAQNIPCKCQKNAIFLNTEDEINLLDLLKKFKNNKIIIFIITLFFTCSAFAYAVMMTPIYRVEAVLTVSGYGRDKQNTSESDSIDDFLLSFPAVWKSHDVAIGVMKSSLVIKKLIEKNNLLSVFYHRQRDAAKRWNGGGNSDANPTIEQVVKMFKGICFVTTDMKSGLVTLAIEWEDAHLAAQWINELIAITNEQLQSAASYDIKDPLALRILNILHQANFNKDNLAIISLIKFELNKRISTKMSEYGFKVIDPPMAPDKMDYVRPKSALMVTLGTVMGLFLSIFVAFIRNSFKK